ncbi:ribosomal RNA-processing protein 9, partial [Tremellales sp. Uapishka_1]
MPDAFFQSDKKRKRPARAGGSTKPYEKPFRPNVYGKGQKVKSKPGRDEDLESDAEGDRGGDLDDMDFRQDRVVRAMSDDELLDENETAAEKRVRLAKGYLKKVRDEIEAAQEDDAYDAAEIDKELIASRLQQDVAEAEGRIHLFLSSHLSSASTSAKFLSTPSHLPTCVALTPQSIFVATKRGSVFRYALPSLKKVGKPFGQGHLAGPRKDGSAQGHKGELLCIAASEDGKYLVTGGRDKVIGVWDVSTDQAEWVRGLSGHKDAVTSISIPPLSNPSSHILTSSLSRHLALHSLSTLSLVDTFFGHQDSIVSVSALKPQSAVTAGSRDRTCRWWRVEEEVQLVFRGGGKSFQGVVGLAEEEKEERLGGGWFEGEAPAPVSRQQAKGKGKEFVEGSMEVVCMLDDQHFLSGGDSGSISLWHTGKKKPIFTQSLAHGVSELTEDSTISGARWITSLASLRGTDIFVSGSWDGSLRLWSLDPSLKSFKPLFTYPIPGFVNGLQLLVLPSGSVDSTALSTSTTPTSSSKKEIVLVAAIGQEPRLGRWLCDKTAKNGVLVLRLGIDEAGEPVQLEA